MAVVDAGDGHADEGGDGQADAGGIDLGTVAGDDAGVFELAYAFDDGGGRKADAAAELGVAGAGVFLEFG